MNVRRPRPRPARFGFLAALAILWNFALCGLRGAAPRRRGGRADWAICHRLGASVVVREKLDMLEHVRRRDLRLDSRTGRRAADGFEDVLAVLNAHRTCSR